MKKLVASQTQTSPVKATCLQQAVTEQNVLGHRSPGLCWQQASSLLWVVVARFAAYVAGLLESTFSNLLEDLLGQ